jgi:hypothetical protein
MTNQLDKSELRKNIRAVVAQQAAFNYEFDDGTEQIMRLIDAYALSLSTEADRLARIDELKKWRTMVLRMSEYIDSPDSLIEYDERIKELQDEAQG